ncbi:hypothetical protein ERJ75_001690800 [Trypanosoma vivax]|nr:hypothetical protein ERJ75_001690800 [Trypanosoma vivax]
MEEAEEALSEAGLKADTKGSALLDDMLRVTLDNGTKTGRTALIAQLALHAQETAADLARRATNTAGKIDQWVSTAFSIISKRGANGRVCINDAGSDGAVTSGNTLMSSNGNALETPGATTEAPSPYQRRAGTAGQTQHQTGSKLNKSCRQAQATFSRTSQLQTRQHRPGQHVHPHHKTGRKPPRHVQANHGRGRLDDSGERGHQPGSRIHSERGDDALKALATQMASSPGEQAAAVTWSKACTWKEHNLCTAKGNSKQWRALKGQSRHWLPKKGAWPQERNAARRKHQRRQRQEQRKRRKQKQKAQVTRKKPQAREAHR